MVRKKRIEIKYNNANIFLKLTALLVTLIVLLILAAVSISAVFSEKGIFSRAEKAGNKYNEAKAREVLETVLLADGQYEKHTNPKYNQDDFLDELIKSQIEGSDVKGDVAIIGEYAFQLDRSVPKIGRYLGLAKDLVFPTVDATVKLAEDKKTATITITAKEEKNGINKIEIWLLGEKIDEFPYENIKTEITLPYTATQNGKYTIKAYGDLMASKTVEVDGILASVKFEPNGNEEWKKEHSTTVTIEETADKVVNAKYVWLTSVATPDDSNFPEEQTFNSGDTITGGNETMTGTYYLWTMLETQSGEKVKWRSEGFNFDNEGPTITAFTSTKYSETGITLSVTVQDTKSGIVKIEYYIDDVIQDSYTETMNATTSSITRTVNITGLSTGDHTCMVKVYDKENNSNTSSKSGTTKLYTWEKWTVKETYYWTKEKTKEKVSAGTHYYYTCYSGYSNVCISQTNGCFYGYCNGNFYRWASYWETANSGSKARYYYRAGNWTTYCNKYNTSNFYYDEYSGTKTLQSRSKGDTKIGEVQSPNSSAYPNNENLNRLLVCSYKF